MVFMLLNLGVYPSTAPFFFLLHPVPLKMLFCSFTNSTGRRGHVLSREAPVRNLFQRPFQDSSLEEVCLLKMIKEFELFLLAQTHKPKQLDTLSYEMC